METKNKLMISCKEATYLISKRQQDKLNLTEKIQLQFHLMMCKYCRRYLKQINYISKGIVRLRSKIEKQSTDISLSNEQKNKMKDALRKQQN